jgi:hypothetical protein
MRVISLAAHRGSFFVRRDSDTTTITPYAELSAWVFDFCFHCLSCFHSVLPGPFESERRLQWCSLPDICISPACTSTPVFRQKAPEVLRFPRYGRRRTKWEPCTVGSERPDTIACRPWAMKKHSQNYSLLGLRTRVHRFGCTPQSRIRVPL